MLCRDVFGLELASSQSQGKLQFYITRAPRMGRSPQARLQNYGPDTLRDGLVFDMHGLGLGTA